jgi:16S rRNA C967 or C1407 C5-methylase (RsmB/RsmF family)/NOL1/NOP2/fmu family ribosome biogenesis protein
MTLPEQLLRDLDGKDGFAVEAFIAAHQQPPITSVRENPAKNTGIFPGSEQVPWCPGGRYLTERPVFTLDPDFHAGAYYVQEASSMFLQHALNEVLPDKRGLRILDLCAAPGGKSTLIASWMDRDSLLISNDVIRTRAAILEENMVRWGYMNTWVTSNDPRDFGRLDGYFDVIVADAPCSGSGLFRKDERAIKEWSESNVQLCSERQQRILADVWPALKQNGILVYATCSYSPQEDEEAVDEFARQHDVASLRIPLRDEWGIEEVHSTGGLTGYRFFPHKVKGEGLFMSVMRKIGAADEIRRMAFKSGHSKQIQQQAGWLLQGDDIIFLQSDRERYCAIRPTHEADLALLRKAVFLRKAGVRLGAPAGKDWIPGHDVALSIDAEATIRSIEVTKEQALRYLKREDMALAETERGWALVKYNGLGLGWVKSLGNRINNYLPKNWRIRMDIGEHMDE